MADDKKSSLERKVLEIQEWLQSLSEEMQCDSYEINEYTVEYLYQLCQLNKKKDECFEFAIKDNLNKAEEYSAESERMMKQLELLGISEDKLSSECQAINNELSDIGIELNLNNPTLENYLVCLSDHTLEEFELKDALEKAETQVSDIDSKLSKLTTQMKKLAEELNEDDSKACEPGEGLDMAVEIETAKGQAQQYIDSTKELKKLLSAGGIKKEYTHEQLQKLADKIEIMADDVDSISKRIALFKELPPSVPLAREQIRQTEIEIEAIKQECFPEVSTGVVL